MARGNDEHDDPTRGALIWRGTRRWAGWWVFLAGLWVVLVDSAKPPELVAGAVAAAIAATAARLVAAQRLVRLDFDPRWLRLAWRPLLALFTDTGLLAGALWRRVVLRRPVQGAFRELRFRASGDDRRSVARRVTAKTIGSFAPNTYVIGFDEETEVLLVHQLVPRGGPDALDPLELR